MARYPAYPRRRRRKRVRTSFLLVAAAGLAAGIWWIFIRGESSTSTDGRLALAPQPTLATDRPEIIPESQPRPGISEKGESPESIMPADPTGPAGQRAESLLAAGRRALENGELITARAYLSEALQLGLPESELPTVRAELTRLGNETIFSPSIYEADPLVSRYVIKPGETLGKIAKANKISADLLAEVNRVPDKNRIRAGQTIKIVTGPFHAVVHKRAYSMDVYLGNTFLKHFKVGLGAEGSTPSGQWVVGTKLTNPTYYPPRGGRIVAADDPENPLGERWIGLVGVGGEAAGQERYGIHGTIEPETVGQNVSLGCIRMYNEDVEALYTYLIPKHSTVTVRN
ncbi:MAG: L,D-transpeptidase family protein [Phycisphaerales bacterium]|nr:MAG: L,D-transpeptidase family protein [Phycisphaerales bacterium]